STLFWRFVRSYTVLVVCLLTAVCIIRQRTSSNTRNQATVQDGRVVIQNVQGRQNRGQGNNARGAGAAGYGGAQNRVGNANSGQAKRIKCYNCNGIGHIARNNTQPKRPQKSEYFTDKMLLMQAQENGVILDEEQLLFIIGGQDNVVDEDVDEQPVQDLALNVDNVFQVDDCDAFDSNNAVYEHHEVHEMHDDVQPNYVVESHANYTSDSNMIPYDQNKLNYMKDGQFKLTEREQKIDEQIRIVITDRNIKDENLKKELHSVKKQFSSTINHNKSMVKEVTSSKKDFKQKENKYLEEFLDMKSLKEKVEDKLYKQDQSLQTVHMLCKPKSYYDGQNKSITPTWITEGERGFEQTKKCYLTEVIPFFKTLKDHFEGIQKALTKEIKEMKEIFEELEAEVDQNVVHRKHEEIERKNILIANDNLIADCLSKDVFYTATNSVLTVSRFYDMHEVLSAAQKRISELEYENFNLQNKIQNDYHNVMTNSLLTEVANLKAQIQENHISNCVIMPAVKSKVLAPDRYVIDVEPIPPRIRNNRKVHLAYLKHLKESVETLRDIVEEAKVERPLDRSLGSAFFTPNALRNS
nr:retrovirus-related Pol polyprotein from transposon TNT 1-94 [Tanacetum cinerariifolium]